MFAPGRTLHAPHLLDIEIAQVTRRYEAKGEIDDARGREGLSDLADLPIQRYPHDLFLPRVWELRRNLTAYDAVYVALAEGLDLLAPHRSGQGSLTFTLQSDGPGVNHRMIDDAARIDVRRRDEGQSAAVLVLLNPRIERLLHDPAARPLQPPGELIDLLRQNRRDVGCNDSRVASRARGGERCRFAPDSAEKSGR